MGMLYDITYFTRHGMVLASYDRDHPGINRAPKGEYAQMRNTNWDGEVVWLDEHGVTETPDFALSDLDFVAKYLDGARFPHAEHRDAVRETIAACRQDSRAMKAYEVQFRALREKLKAREPVVLYRRAAE